MHGITTRGIAWLNDFRHLFTPVLLRVGLLAAASILLVGTGDASSRFNNLGHRLKCACGCREILLECTHIACPYSDRMRAELVAAVDRGENDDLALQSFVQKYGPTVLATPAKTGFNRLAWIVPSVLGLLFPDNHAIYPWVFLILAVMLLIALSIVVARNMDALTGTGMQSSSAVAAAPAGAAPGRCSSCGQPITCGARFCPHCGTASSTSLWVSSPRKVCPSCGADNPPGARFCKECGRAA